MKRNSNSKVLWMAQTAVFAAIVVVVQLFLGGITVSGVSFSLVLIPIAVGGMVAGPAAGAILGLTFGVVTLINGIIGVDPFTAFLLQSGTAGAIITPMICLVKGTAAGFVSAIVYKALKNKNHFAATVVAAAVAPVVNTGLFILGALLISGSISGYMQANGIAGMSVVYFLVIGCAGINFIVEFLVNVVLSPAVYSLVSVVSKGKRVK